MADTPFLLVPLDGSKESEHAVPAACELGRALGLTVRFIHAARVAEGAWSVQDLDRARENFASYVKDLTARFNLACTSETVVVGWGPAAQEVLAASEGARFIVIASHGKGGFQAAFVGSVADKVVRGARVPVLVIPAVGTPPALARRPIVVPLDGSKEAEHALAVARELAGPLNTSLTLVRAFNIPPPAGVEFAYYPPDVGTALQEAAESYLAEVAQKGEHYVVVNGGPSSVVVDTVQRLDAGLVVMGSTGKGLAKRLALGSTTDRVLHTLHRPVLVVPPEAGG